VSQPPSILVACPDCDLLQRLGDIPEGSTARCSRCGGLLRKRPRNGLERALALTYSAAILFVVANSFPFLSFEMKGEETQTTLATGIIDMYNQGKWEISLLVAFTIVIAPVAQISILAYLLTPLRLGRVPYGLPAAFRVLRHMLPWSMMEVFMIGILVAIPKLMGMASVIPGIALFAFVLLMLVLSAANAAFDPESVWRSHEAAK
jgi:paraquat-inducible protein A